MMTDRRKIRRVSLKVEDAPTTHVIGIASSDNDYRISQVINSLAGLSFAIDKPLSVQDDKRELTFSRFSSSGKFDNGNYSIISNKSGSSWLMPSFSNIDYFITIPEESSDVATRTLMELIKKGEMITGVFLINLEKVKDRNKNQLM